MRDLRDWLGTFGMIVIRPLPSTFVKEAKKAEGKFASAVVWLVLVVLAAHVWLYLVTGSPDALLAAVATVFLIPIAFLFLVYCIHMLQQRLFRKKAYHYPELLYLLVGICVPIAVVNVILGRGALADILFWVICAYGLVLAVMAVAAVTRLRIWQASIAVVLSLILAAGGFVCIGLFIISLIQTVPRVI